MKILELSFHIERLQQMMCGQTVRVMVEAQTQEECETYVTRIVEVVKEEMGLE